MSMLDPIPIGYFAKRITRRPEGPDLPGVEEICSLSECISPGPDDWFSRWTHNGACLFDREDAIGAIVAEEHEPDAFELFAYQIIPVRFAPDGETAMTASDLPGEAGRRPNAIPPGADYDLLGYDCIQTEWERNIVGFGCSPLSCNGMAAGIAVNRFCLIDSLDNAIAAARRFAKEQPEPGTYYVVEVWRKRRAAKAGLDGV